ncbi:MAG: hypothetical protein ACRELZ_17920 [Candidatus Rokuibacteriota bacterium]
MLTSTWAAWKGFARRIGDLQARALLTVFYFIVVGPFAIGLKALRDPLRLKLPSSGGWIDRPDPPEVVARQARRQF